ncbi:MAG: hypothetical protein FD146_1236 [Anaerolineaceae bacterium]|nr:MAG: hypothetical protein FD146_1236 [Anaerolineaceae bacterium]
MTKKPVITPKGLVPNLCRWVGTIWVWFSMLAGLVSLYRVWEWGSQRYIIPQIFIRALPMVLEIGAVILTISLPGLILAGLFPSIRIGDEGIGYRYLFMQGLVRWQEIETVAKIKWPTECLALVIARPFAILRRLWLPSLHGQLMGIGKPVVLLTMGWEHRDELLGKIQEQQKVSSVPVTSSPANE